MAEIIRHFIHDETANSGVIVAGDYVFIGTVAEIRDKFLKNKLLERLTN